MTGRLPGLLGHLDRWRTESPSRVVLRDFHVSSIRQTGIVAERSVITAAELWAGAICLAAGLRQDGIEPADVVVVQLPNWHEYLQAHLAVFAIGAVTMPLSPIYRERDLQRLVTLAQPRAIVVPRRFKQRDLLPAAQRVAERTPGLDRIIVVDGEESTDTLRPWAELLARGSDATTAQEEITSGRFALAEDDLMLLNYTSGTTGEPKGVMHSAGTLSAGVRAITSRLQLGPQDVFFVPSTLGHAAGFLNGMYLPIAIGAETVYLDEWDADIATRVVERTGVTYGSLMPTHLSDMMALPETERRTRTWRTCRVSGGPIPRQLMREAQGGLPHLRLCPGWGMSEALFLTSCSPSDAEEVRMSTDGAPFDGFEVEVRDAEGLATLAEGEVGELVVRTPSLSLGYFQRPELSAASRTPDGWFRTGDLGKHVDGRVLLAGRKKDLIIRGGENIPAVEVEELLRNHPDVGRVAVIGVPDRRLGERVCAVIEVKHGVSPLTLADLQAFFWAAGGTKQFTPEELVVVDAMPMTPSGKIRKAALRERHADLIRPVEGADSHAV